MKEVPASDWEELLADMVLDTGLPFEVVVGFTQAQFLAMQRAVRRKKEEMISLTMARGFGGAPGDKAPASRDDTAELEKRVAELRRTTGRSEFALHEVMR